MRRDHQAALDAFETLMASNNRAPLTRVALRHTASLFLASLRGSIAKASLSDVRRHLAARAEVLAPATLAAEASRLRSFLGSLVDLGHVASNVADEARPPWAPHAQPLLLAEPIIGALLDAALIETARHGLGRPAALRDRAAIEVLYGVGVRASELRAARLVDLNLADGSLLVRPAKRGPSRVLPLPPASLPHLRGYLADGRPVLAKIGRDEGALIITNAGRPLRHSAVQKLVDRVALKAERRAHPHAFRRAVATHLARGGASVLAIKELLGHEGLETTQRYVEVDREDLRRSVDALDRLRARGR